MSSGHFVNNVDLDSIFELASEFPQLQNSLTVSNFHAPNSADLLNRFIPSIQVESILRAPDVGYIVNTPYIPAWTETLNEGGELIIIEHPAIPAGSNDLSVLLCKKGTVWGFYNYPRISRPSPNEINITVNSTVSNQNGTLTGSNMVTFNLPGSLINVNSQIDNFIFTYQVLSGSVYSAPTKLSLNRLSNQVTYNQSIRVGLSTNTPYSNGYGSSQAIVRFTAHNKGNNNLYSNAVESPHLSQWKNVVFDVTLTHVVNSTGGGGGGGFNQ